MRWAEGYRGSGGGSVKPFIGFTPGNQSEVSPDDVIVQRAKEAIGKHLRQELVNRLTKIVHFNPLRMDAAREIVGKLVKQLNSRIANRGVTVKLDDSAVELILSEGFSPEYGARNLERVMDRLLGEPIAEKILSGVIANFGGWRPARISVGSKFVTLIFERITRNPHHQAMPHLKAQSFFTEKSSDIHHYFMIQG